MHYKLISIDLAKTVFQVAAFRDDNSIAFNKRVKRAQLLDTLRQCEPTRVVMEACYSANYWGREIAKLGHDTRLVSARVVKAMLVGNKNDSNDAVAIGEAAQRPRVQLLRVKGLHQQDIQSLLRARELLIKERTALINQTRGFLAEYGIIVAQGLAQLQQALPALLEDAENGLTTTIRSLLKRWHERWLQQNQELETLTHELISLISHDEVFKLLQSIPGVGPIVAAAIMASVNEITDFRNGRQFAAWLGLTPTQYSSGLVNRLGSISKRGNEGLRRLLIHGARAVLNWCEKKEDGLSKWLQQLKARKHSCKVTVALANKLARIVWAVLTTRQEFDITKACQAVK